MRRRSIKPVSAGKPLWASAHDSTSPWPTGPSVSPANASVPPANPSVPPAGRAPFDEVPPPLSRFQSRDVLEGEILPPLDAEACRCGAAGGQRSAWSRNGAADQNPRDADATTWEPSGAASGAAPFEPSGASSGTAFCSDTTSTTSTTRPPRVYASSQFAANQFAVNQSVANGSALAPALARLPVRHTGASPRRATVAQKTARSACTGLIALGALISTAELSLPVDVMASWTAILASATATAAASPESTDRITADLVTADLVMADLVMADQIRARAAVAGAASATGSTLRVSQIPSANAELERRETSRSTGSADAVPPGPPLPPAPTPIVRAIDLPPLDTLALPAPPSATPGTKAWVPVLFDLAVQSMTAAPLEVRTLTGDTVATPVAVAIPPHVMAPVQPVDVAPRPILVQPVLVQPIPVQPIPVQNVTLPLPPIGTVRQVVLKRTQPAPADRAPDAGSRAAAKPPGVAGTARLARPAVALPAATVVSASARLPYPRLPYYGASLKDGGPADTATATVVATGAHLLTAHRGAAPLPPPAFLSRPLFADTVAPDWWTSVPPWAHAWLVDRIEPIEAFRQTN